MDPSQRADASGALGLQAFYLLLGVTSGAWMVTGGRSVVEAGPGHFVHVPARVVHRESNPTALPSSAVIARAGIGEPTVNVDGPDGA